MLFLPQSADEMTAFVEHRGRVLVIEPEATVAPLPDGPLTDNERPNFGRLRRGLYKGVRISASFNALTRMTPNVATTSRLFVYGVVQRILLLLANEARRDTKRQCSGLAPRQVRREIEAIAEVTSATLSRSELAAFTGISDLHFSRTFKGSLGAHPYCYQFIQRIKQARVVVDQGGRAANEIAFDPGYGPIQASTHMLARQMGLSPAAFGCEVRR